MQYAELTWDYDEKEHQSFIENLAPIVLFTYNRLDHTRPTIEALQKNIYAAESHLIIYSDGPRDEVSEGKVAAVRAYLHTVQGFKTVEIIERPENWGLARNIIDGVTNIVNKYGKIIVLEDDIVTSKWFLKYMNDALKIYEKNEKVMQISGYSYVNGRSISETYFLPLSSSWGWATWQRCWKLFERNPQQLVKSYSKEMISEFDLAGRTDFWHQVRMNAEGKLYTWAVFFYEIVIRYKGICLFPRESLVNNIGFDGSGENCGIRDSVMNLKNGNMIRFFPNDLAVDDMQFKRVKDSFVCKTGFLFRLKSAFRRCFFENRY